LNPKLFTSLIFLGVYGFLIFSHKRRSLIAWIGVSVLLLFGILRPLSLLAYIDWNVLGIFWGTLVISELFSRSKAPARIGELILSHTPNVGWAIISLSFFSGLISAFVENVATVLILAPVALEVSRRLKVSPVPFIIGISLSSNLQGSATLVGDPPSMILASAASLKFNDFFFFRGRPNLFFAVELAALSSLLVLYLAFRGEKRPVEKVSPEKVKSYFPSLLLVGLIITLALSSLLRIEFPYLLGGICVGFGIIGMVWSAFSKMEKFSFVYDSDWDTFFFLAGIFSLVGGLNEAGVLHLLANWIGSLASGGLFLTYIILISFSVLISGFVDNVPFFTAMVGVIKALSLSFGFSPYLLLFGTVVATTVGGNITPIGASANIVGVGILRREGYRVSFLDFVKIGLPFSLVATLVGCGFLWLIWH